MNGLLLRAGDNPRPFKVDVLGPLYERERRYKLNKVCFDRYPWGYRDYAIEALNPTPQLVVVALTVAASAPKAAPLKEYWETDAGLGYDDPAEDYYDNQ